MFTYGNETSSLNTYSFSLYRDQVSTLNAYTESINKLIEEFAKLPSIGQKTAERLAHYILDAETEDAMQLARAIRDVKQKVRRCSVCFNISEGDLCNICQDTRRNRFLLCVVEQPNDLIALEKTGHYKGLYHVLMGHIAPLENTSPEDLTIQRLVERVKNDGIQEVIIATNPNLEGDGTALFITKQLGKFRAKITCLARGIPTGSSLEYANNAILSDALSRRQEMTVEAPAHSPDHRPEAAVPMEGNVS